jgi:hypothetical protein
MAARYFTQFFYSFFKKPVLIAGKISLSAAAAVSSFDIPGVASVTKNGAGTYDIVLQDRYYAVVSFSSGVADSAEDLVVDFVSVLPQSKTLSIKTKVAGVVADVTDACTVTLSLIFNDSSV